MLGIVKQPILVFGLGASGALWLFDSLGNRFTDFGDWGVWGLIIVGIALWRLGGRQPVASADPLPSQFDRAEVEQALTRVRSNLEVLAAETDASSSPERFQERLEALEQTDDSRPLSIGVTGRKAVGKTALVQALQRQLVQGSTLEVQIQDLPSCLQREDVALLAQAQQADILLLVTDGDIRESELDLVQRIAATGQALLLVWNQSDRHPPQQQAQILGRIRQQAEPYLRGDRILAIAAAPSPIEVRHYKSDNSIETSTTTPAPELASLSECLETLHEDAPSLIWATTYRAAQSLRAEIRQEINRLRRQRALPVIRQSQWIAAAAAFGNPVPSLDLLATAAVNVQLVMNLGKIYQQKLSIEQAKVAAKTLAEVLVKLGLVEVSTQLVSAALKQNPITFVAGGATQGLSAAYLTHIAGLSLIDYFETCEEMTHTHPGMVLNGERFAAIVKRVFETNRRKTFIQSLIRQAGDRFATKTA
ncbi:MAG: DUF697 domain-containing protein [Phormidium sp. GEM2.Bin31]|nr:MAG: DUF697 domain-containing protein [Phormidium sp. GEM2.Bin31]